MATVSEPHCSGGLGLPLYLFKVILILFLNNESLNNNVTYVSCLLFLNTRRMIYKKITASYFK